MKLYTRIFIIFIFFITSINLFSLEKKGGVRIELQPGKKVQSVIDLKVRSYKTFTFKVLPDTYAIELTLTGAPADLDLFVNYGRKINNYDNVDFIKATDSNNEKLIITRLSDPALTEGIYFVDVAYQRDDLPAPQARKITDIPFSLSLKEKKISIAGSLNDGIPFNAFLYPADGMASTFSFNVPENTNSFRIDISKTNSDLDLMCSYNNRMVTRKTSEFISETLLGKESLVIKNKDGSPLRAGVYYIAAFDQAAGEDPEPFSITASFSQLPPPQLLLIPKMVPPENELENALSATVEVIGEAGKGSGCLVSSDGYIITNWHVIKNNNDAPSGNIFIALDLSSHTPPDELFKARLIDYRISSDLALLKIDSGLYGQPLPKEETFPFFTFGDSKMLKIGQPVSILGYPGVGGTGSRASISLTTGIVSGFEDTATGYYIKTDAEINSGNSGGAVIDVYYNLVGIPTVTIGEDSGQIGYITPVSSIPNTWFRYFR